MSRLTWDQVGERFYETGVDHGVLYVQDNEGNYPQGVAWNGLTTVTESPSGADASPQYADNIKYLNLVAAEEFGATIEAFTYPEEFALCDGSWSEGGITLGQQTRRHFGLCYRTKIGNDIEGTDLGYKLHIVYGCLAAPSERAYGTINDSPEAISFSWEVTTTPVAPPTNDYNLKPMSLITFDSTKVEDADALAELESILYGSDGVDARLPLPGELFDVFNVASSSPDVEVRMVGANAPTYNDTTHVVTLPAVTNVQWKVNGTNKSPGAQPALSVGQTAVVTAHGTNGHVVTGDDDWTFDY